MSVQSLRSHRAKQRRRVRRIAPEAEKVFEAEVATRMHFDSGDAKDLATQRPHRVQRSIGEVKLLQRIELPRMHRLDLDARKIDESRVLHDVILSRRARFATPLPASLRDSWRWRFGGNAFLHCRSRRMSGGRASRLCNS